MKAGLSIILVNYNGAKFLLNCINSFEQYLIKNNIPHEFLIIDNASTDDSVEVINNIIAKNTQIHFFPSTFNHGFAKANNILIKKASYDNLVLLNNDTLTIDIQNLCNKLKENQINQNTVYTCKILNADNTDQKNIFTYPSIFKLIVDIFLIKKPLFKIYNFFFTDKQSSDYSKKYFSGCYFVINKTLFESVNGFDDSFFFYHEECDLFLRLETYGIKKEVLNDKIIHYGSGGVNVSDFSFKNYYLNLAKLIIKHQYGSEGKIKSLFSMGFKFRIALLKLGFNIPYSPFSHTYFNNKDFKVPRTRVIEIHQNTLKAIVEC
jgi:GT2 family glycosyltransferase